MSLARFWCYSGCNYQLTNFAFGQLNNFVLGTEGDAAWSTATGSAKDQPPFGRETTSTTNETSFDTLRGRLGYAWDRFLFYGLEAWPLLMLEFRSADP
jgi:opacity protein-like surface antigen